MSGDIGRKNVNEVRQWPSFTVLPAAGRRAGMIISGADDIAFRPVGSSAAARVLQRVTRRLQDWLAMEEAYGGRFLFVSFFSAAGSIGYFSLASEPSWLRLFLLGLFLTALAYLFRRCREISLVFVFMVMAVAGALCAKAETVRLATAMLGNEVSTFVTGRIAALEKTERGYRLVLDILATERPVLQDRVRRVQLSARSLPDEVTIGDGLKGLVRLRPPSGPVRPGAYDFGFHNYFRGIGAQGFFMGKPEAVAVKAPDGLFALLQLYVAQLRQVMTRRIHTAIDGEAGSIAAALITGQRGGITKGTNDALRLAGLAHILSISGLHMAMVTGMVLVAIRAVLGLFPVFSSRYAPKKLASVIALGAAAFYLLLSGADVAAQRSFVMVAVMLLAVLFNRAALTMRNLAVAAFVTIVLVPHEILGPGFQMSFAATAVLVAGFGWWSRRKNRWQTTGKISQSLIYRFAVVPLVSTIASSLLAGTASGIYAAFHFNNTAPYGMLGNALAFPVMSVAVMPFALVAAVLMPFYLEWLPLQIMGLGVVCVQKIALWVASLSPVVNPGAIPPPALVMLSLGLVLLVYLRSPLRLVAFLPLGVGVMLYGIASLPLVLISENGRLVAVVREDRALAINTRRPPAFILSNWQAVLRTRTVLLPNKNDQQAFRCKEDFLCSTHLENGQVFAIVTSAPAKEKACQNSDIIFLNYIDDDAACTKGLTISRQQLALYGTAEIYRSFGSGNVEIVWASGLPVRPWNAHRRFAKAARGMP